ncbi:hypothetical protein [Arthrobacter sp. SAFR-014]|uniref:hypothetical protein n=1 Tax=unclassified Arthrobacter TaxID=235627 RepID=UPI003F7B5C01
MKKPIFAAALLLSLVAGSLASSPALAVDSTPSPPAQATETADASTSGAETTGTATMTPSPGSTTSESPGATTATEPATGATTDPATDAATGAAADPVTEPATTDPAAPSPPADPPVTEPEPEPKFVTHGAIGGKWTRMGGATGVLGEPISNERCSAGMCVQNFKAGSVYWTPASGAHPVLHVSGRTGPYWYGNGRLAAFGYPVTDEVAVAGGTTQKFSSGRLLTSSGNGVLPVWTRGAIGARWTALGGVNGLGLPATKEACGLKNRGCSQTFAKGSVYWSPATGAQLVRGAVRTRWTASGAQNSSMGYPVTGEICGQPGKGCVQRFQGGRIYWSPTSGAWIIRGAIGGKFAATGATRGSLGYPVSNEKCTSGQCVQSFQRGFISWISRAGTRSYGITECQKLNNGRSRYSAYGANRVLLTFTQGYKQSRATNVYCVRIAGMYLPDWKTDGYVGASGFKAPGVPSGPTRNLYSPTGSYSVTEAFGLGNPGTQLPYRTLNPRSRWGGNPWTATYNKYFESSSWVGWDENMWYFATRASHDYRQGVVINYNRPNIVQDAGFAIFLHMNKVPTAGCISLDDWAVVDYIKKSKPGDRIIMGTYGALFR